MRTKRHIPAPFERYHHYKGGDYQVITLAAMEDTGEELVIYQALYGEHRVWARRLDSFLGEIDPAQHPEAAQRYRFERIGADHIDSAPDRMTESVNPASASEETPTLETVNTAQEVPVQDHNDADLTTEGMDPRILQFLDARTNRERLDLLAALHADITDGMIDTLAVALGVEIAPGSIEMRYDDLRDCLLTISKYELEGNRLR